MSLQLSPQTDVSDIFLTPPQNHPSGWPHGGPATKGQSCTVGVSRWVLDCDILMNYILGVQACFILLIYKLLSLLTFSLDLSPHTHGATGYLLMYCKNYTTTLHLFPRWINNKGE